MRCLQCQLDMCGNCAKKYFDTGMMRWVNCLCDHADRDKDCGDPWSGIGCVEEGCTHMPNIAP